ncbi:hypothetical protein MGYG_01615 [Nannizzia gypsea CBS 118893]|uniref:Uncharacterized protein n=1 Tax=Arthroderma gypseum (strain ATCC MYA-4604 / CBS 118893) TaxID=535722 RepID=E5R1V5_ARTGP|nr:hypothetical protein MGYG_01615 [Nannizzia gypsea CBS 118893]EFQ98589.1 hypothetical protein MGYG_01615 [Nannizzia gypsea CBS 118893]
MGPSLFNNYFNGPTVALPPPSQLHQANQLASTDSMNHSFAHSGASRFPHHASVHADGIQSGPPKSFTGRQVSFNTAPYTAAPSRKRSRDEFDLGNNDNHTGFSVIQKVPTPPTVPEEEPIYGEGMVLINPKNGLAVSASSQTGTWYEEKAEEKAVSSRISAPVTTKVNHDHTNSLPSRKTQRLDATASAYDDITALSISNKLQSNTNDVCGSGSSLKGPEMPHVDDATRLLGISWQRMANDDKDMVAAIRGWEKYINNHFSTHLHDAQIMLKHRGLNVYLVSALPKDQQQNDNASQRHFYLFDDNLTEGQLVGRDWQSSIRNLQSSPIAFEAGSVVLKAAEKLPERQVEDKGVPIAAGGMNGCMMGIAGASTGTDIQMEID